MFLISQRFQNIIEIFNTLYINRPMVLEHHNNFQNTVHILQIEIQPTVSKQEANRSNYKLKNIKSQEIDRKGVLKCF
jgi:hypothetical protein